MIHNNAIEVKLYECEQIADDKLLFAVIAARYNGKWIFCKHKERDTYEIPGGRREKGENIDNTAKRELIEETGALQFDLSPACVYSVIKDNQEPSYGKLYFAKIYELGELPQFEIAQICLFDTLPDKLTYPQIQPILFEHIVKHNINKLSFERLDVDLHRDFLLAAHTETFYITFGTQISNEFFEREIEWERNFGTGVFLDGELIGICDMQIRKRDYGHSELQNYCEKQKSKIITLCGSAKFKDEFFKVQKELMMKGNIVISPEFFGDTDNIADEIKIMLGESHKRKIDISDEIYVINVDGYIGNSTKNEIEYAKEHGKKISYLFEPWVHFFYLAPKYRGRGFGKQLVVFAEDFCRKHGLKSLGLRTGENNIAARRLYERSGFVRTSKFDRAPEVGYIKKITLDE